MFNELNNSILPYSLAFPPKKIIKISPIDPIRFSVSGLSAKFLHLPFSRMWLRGLLDAYLRQQDDASLKKLSFEERFILLIDFEWTHRQNLRLSRLLKQSGMAWQCCIEDIDFNVAQFGSSFSNCEWLSQHQNIIISSQLGSDRLLGKNKTGRIILTGFVELSRFLSFSL